MRRKDVVHNTIKFESEQLKANAGLSVPTTPIKRPIIDTHFRDLMKRMNKN